MATETICIPVEKYAFLKSRAKIADRLEKVDHNLIEQLVESLEDAKCGRIRRVA